MISRVLCADSDLPRKKRSNAGIAIVLSARQCAAAIIATTARTASIRVMSMIDSRETA